MNTPSGMPAVEASSPSRIAVSGVSSAGLRTTVLPAARAGREPPAGDGHREVPGHDHPDDAERLLERDVHAAGHRDLLAEQPLRGARVVSPARRGRCPPPSARCRSCDRRCAPRARRVPRCGRPPARRTAAAGARGRRARRPPGGECRVARARWRHRPRRAGCAGTCGTTCSVAGLMTANVSISEPLEPAVALPVGDGLAECLQLDPRHVRVVLLRPRRRRSRRRTPRMPPTVAGPRPGCRAHGRSAPDRRCPFSAGSSSARSRCRRGRRRPSRPPTR